MRILIIFFYIAFASCSKSNIDKTNSNSGTPGNPASVHTYTLKLQVDDNSNALYSIQKSSDTTHFSTMQTFSYDASVNGGYNFDLLLLPGDFIRVQAISGKDTVNSTIVQAQ